MTKTKLLFGLIMYRKKFIDQEVVYEFAIYFRTAPSYLIETSESGVPLYTISGRNGNYQTLKNKTLPPLTFDENETFTILFAVQSLQHYKILLFDIKYQFCFKRTIR